MCLCVSVSVYVPLKECVCVWSFDIKSAWVCYSVSVCVSVCVRKCNIKSVSIQQFLHARIKFDTLMNKKKHRKKLNDQSALG
jgi:hypothetical protein